ncbi:MAG: LptF/LptG family permease [Mangrovibacterium sp.]
MKKLHRYIIQSFIGPFILTFFICVFVLLMQFLWKYIDEMVGKGLEWDILAELMFYAAVGLTPMAFPLAMLLASIMTFGNLGENYELVAMKAAGISLFRIMKPLIFVAIGLSLFAFYCSNSILPKTNLKFNSILRSVQNQKPEMAVAEGVFSNDIDGYSIKVERKNKENGMMYNLLIYDHTDNQGNVSVTIADSGRMDISNDKQNMIMTLFAGESCSEEDFQSNKRTQRYKFRRSYFQKQVILVPISGFSFEETNSDDFRNSFRMQNIEQLAYFDDSLQYQYADKVQKFALNLKYNHALNNSMRIFANRLDTAAVPERYSAIAIDSAVNWQEKYELIEPNKRQDVINTALTNAKRNKQTINQNLMEMSGFKKIMNRYGMEIHRKFTWAVACLIFFFIGAPLGAIIRKGGLGLPTVISILLFIAYYIVSISGEKFAREDVWSIANGMWFGSLIFLPLGIFLTFKAASDSELLNTEVISLKIKTIFKRLTNNQKDMNFKKKNKQ